VLYQRNEKHERTNAAKSPILISRVIVREFNSFQKILLENQDQIKDVAIHQEQTAGLNQGDCQFPSCPVLLVRSNYSFSNHDRRKLSPDQ
jgi:hypothetical protein